MLFRSGGNEACRSTADPRRIPQLVRVVVLRFVDQKSIKEVAKEIRKTEGAVKQLQFRALSTLKARMEGADG